MLASVIIPTFNYGRFLDEAIESVLGQDVENLEVIVVDDGSTDDTADVLSRMADPRLRAIRIPKSGVSVARNVGLKAARGRYLAFLDADDLWRAGKLCRQIEILEAEPDVGLVFTDFVRFEGSGNYLESHFSFTPEIRSAPSRPTRVGSGRVITRDTLEMFASISLFATWTQTVVLRADAVRGVEFPPGVRLCEDSWYMYRVYPRVTAAFIDEPLVEVRRHGNNSYSNPLSMIEPEITMLKGLLSENLAPHHQECIRRRLGVFYAAQGYWAERNDGYGTALAAYSRALGLPGRRGNALKHLTMLPVRAANAIVRRYLWPRQGRGTS
jgi:glycosyltransferase involved in cell wall biosynthesis